MGEPRYGVDRDEPLNVDLVTPRTAVHMRATEPEVEPKTREGAGKNESADVGAAVRMTLRRPNCSNEVERCGLR